MPKLRKRRLQTKQNNKKNLFFMFIMLPILALTVFALLQPQRIMQFAEGFNAPPLFGCLHTGEADPTLCGTRMGQEGGTLLKVNGQKFVGQNVYYNDTLSGSFTYKNVGDQPITIANYGIAAGSLKQFYIAEFEPLEGTKMLAPGETLTSKESRYLFTSDSPSEGWVVGAGITDTDGQHLPITEATNVRINSTCTALRVKPLTAKDKSNIQSICSKDSKNPLCTSRQYCELFKGGLCSGPVLGEPRENQQCDENIVLDQKEQDVLEELCKVHPDSDACKDFCKRSIGSKICPVIKIWVDSSGKQVFPEKSVYLADAGTKIDNSPQAVAGIAITQETNDTTVTSICPPGTISSGGGITGETCSPAPPPPAPVLPRIQVPSVIKPGAIKPKTIVKPGTTLKPGPQKPVTVLKPACASKRAAVNTPTVCCDVGKPVINGCCTTTPACGYNYTQVPVTRANCPVKSTAKVCCAQDSDLVNGKCVKKGAPGSLRPTNPTNPVIVPPRYQAPPANPINPNDCSPAERSSGVCGNNPAPISGEEGAPCETTRPQTCKSGKCIPAINDMGGQCTAVPVVEYKIKPN